MGYTHTGMLSFIQLEPQYHHRVWGGRRLHDDARPVGEAWLIAEGNRVCAGPHAGKTLQSLCAEFGADLLGSDVVGRSSMRFPLLIKLLDCNDWLSVQVHPNDAQARSMIGPGQFGKTEAWHVLEAGPGARLIAGVRPGTTRDELTAAIRGGSVLDLARQHEVRAGDTVFMPAGTLHALGPGLLIYEVQQTSDITFRVWDWDRPPSAGRALHIDESVTVTDPSLGGEIVPLDAWASQPDRKLISCEYFELWRLDPAGAPVRLDTQGRTFHAITVIDGTARLRSGDSDLLLDRHASALVPATLGEYWLEGSARALLAAPPVGRPTRHMAAG